MLHPPMRQWFYSFLPLYLDDEHKPCIAGQEISGRKYGEPNVVQKLQSPTKVDEVVSLCFMSRRPKGVPRKEFHSRSLDDVDDELAETWHFTGRPLEHATQQRHEAMDENPSMDLPKCSSARAPPAACDFFFMFSGRNLGREEVYQSSDATLEVSRECPTSLEIKRGIFSLHPATASEGRGTKGRLKLNERTNKRTHAWASSWTNNLRTASNSNSHSA